MDVLRAMHRYLSTDHLRFLIHEYLQAPQRLAGVAHYAAYDAEAYDMVMDAAEQIGDAHLFPHYTIMDREKATCEAGVVWTHPVLAEGIKAIAEGGWLSAHAPEEVGGQSMPTVLNNVGSLLLMAANGNIAAYAHLTVGASNLILHYGSEALKARYLPAMYAGRFQGTMALTEPQAGSSLSDITATARPLGDGQYAITGQKIYISGGDHAAAENIVHLLLARIDGAPAGTKGISLFVVPKQRPEGEGWVDNDVITSGIYGKMGQKGYVAAHLMYGENSNTIGYIVGEPHQGLRYMFSMMNEARIGTGIMATGTASAAYYASLKYAHERPQGRHPSQKDMSQPQVTIIEHADVRRMLLKQKSIVEGSMALLLEASLWSDLAENTTGDTQREAHLLLELLTPVIKTFPSEYGTQSVMQAMQVLGGAGYCNDFPIEQYYRDIRVNAIYEGTTGIHGMDLLGRKVLMEQGAALKLLAEKMAADIAASAKTFPVQAEALGRAAAGIAEVTQHLGKVYVEQGAEAYLADATLYLDYFGLVVIAWEWLRMAASAQARLDAKDGLLSADFYRGKVATMDYFFEYELPMTRGLHARLKSTRRVTLELDAALID